MNHINIDTYGIRATLATPLLDFAEFVHGNYACFTCDEVTDPHILVNYSAESGKEAGKARASLLHVGGGVYIGEKELYWENEFGFKVLLRLNYRQYWSIQAFHGDLLRNKSDEERYQDFQRSMRWVLHFPIFTQLRLFQNKVLLHGAAVVKNKRALVFLGLNKVGKSTLVRYLIDKGFAFMSDNFLFCEPDIIYGFPERLRLSEDSLERLKLDNFNKQRIYGKYHFSLGSENICLKAKPEACFIMTNGPAVKLSPLDAEQAGLIVDAMHNFLQEFPQYSYFAFLPFLGFHLENESLEVHCLLRKTRWFHLQYPMDWRISAVIKEVLSCL
jgi:hypothetical protein